MPGKIFLVGLFTLLPGLFLLKMPEALARQWVMLGGGNPVVFVDLDSIKGEGDTRTFWSRIVYENDKYQSGYLYRFSTSLMYVNCQKEKIASIKTILYDDKGSVVKSFDFGDSMAEINSELVVPDTIGEAQLRYVCDRRTPNAGRSGITNTSSSFETASPISKQQAIGVINKWLRAKREIFAPPYSQQKIEELTTGSFRQELLASNSPINWLKTNNAWYDYGSQTIEQTRLFATSKTGKAIIELKIVEYVTYYEKSSAIPSKSGWKTTNVRYYLESSNNQWKIDNYMVIP